MTFRRADTGPMGPSHFGRHAAGGIRTRAARECRNGFARGVALLVALSSCLTGLLVPPLAGQSTANDMRLRIGVTAGGIGSIGTSVEFLWGESERRREPGHPLFQRGELGRHGQAVFRRRRPAAVRRRGSLGNRRIDRTGGRTDRRGADLPPSGGERLELHRTAPPGWESGGECRTGGSTVRIPRTTRLSTGDRSPFPDFTTASSHRRLLEKWGAGPDP